MSEIVVKGEHMDAVKTPAIAYETAIHPITKRPGRWRVKVGKPVQVYDKVARKNIWRFPREIEPINEVVEDNNIFFVVGGGTFGPNDWEELSKGGLERRQKRLQNDPHPHIKGSVIAEAVREVQLRRAEEYTTEAGISFHRPAATISVPRDHRWANAMAERATDWRAYEHALRESRRYEQGT